MKGEKVLLILILAEFVLIVLGSIVDYAFEPPLVVELRGYASSRVAASTHASAALLTGLWSAVVVGTLLGWVGLLYLVREARALYLASWAAYLALGFLRGPVVESAVGSVTQMLMAIVGGGILSLVYFSELRTKFRPLASAVRAGSARAT